MNNSTISKNFKFLYALLFSSLFILAWPISKFVKTGYEKTSHFITKKIKSKKNNRHNESLINNTKKEVIENIKNSNEFLLGLLDQTIEAGNGKLKIMKSLRLYRECSKKLKQASDELEKLVDETIIKLETKNDDKKTIIQAETENFISQAKDAAAETLKNVATELRGAIGKKPEVVQIGRSKTIEKMEEFEKNITEQVTQFGKKLANITQA